MLASRNKTPLPTRFCSPSVSVTPPSALHGRISEHETNSAAHLRQPPTRITSGPRPDSMFPSTDGIYRFGDHEIVSNKIHQSFAWTLASFMLQNISCVKATRQAVWREKSRMSPRVSGECRLWGRRGGGGGGGEEGWKESREMASRNYKREEEEIVNISPTKKHGVLEWFIGRRWILGWNLSTGHWYMTFEDSKNVLFTWFDWRPNFSTKNTGMPDFYSVKLDVNQIKREIHFWNQQTSYINALHSDSIPNYIAGRKSIVGRRGRT